MCLYRAGQMKDGRRVVDYEAREDRRPAFKPQPAWVRVTRVVIMILVFTPIIIALAYAALRALYQLDGEP